MTNSFIRRINQNDIPEVSHIFTRAYSGEDWQEQWSYETAKERIQELLSLPHGIGFVYVFNGVITGCMICEVVTWCTGKQLEIKELFVDPTYQKNGIGKSFMDYINGFVSEHGITNVFLWTNNSRSLINFYTRTGYRVDTTVIRFEKPF